MVERSLQFHAVTMHRLGGVTMTTESRTNTCAQPLTNQTLSLILTLTLYTTKQQAIVNIQHVLRTWRNSYKTMLLHSW